MWCSEGLMHFDRFCHGFISLKKVGKPVPDLFRHLLLSYVGVPLSRPQGTMTKMDLHHADVQWFLPENPSQERSGPPVSCGMGMEPEDSPSPAQIQHSISQSVALNLSYRKRKGMIWSD